jgi:hypothetical protein
VESKPSDTLRLLDPLREREGTVFDKPAPDGPPNPPTRSIPPHIKKLVRFFEGIIADEALLLDLCVDRTVGIVKFNYEKRVTGGDGFGEHPTPAHFIAMAAPLSVELYKQVLVSINDRRDEYEKLLDEAKKELESGSGKSSIILPT